MHDTHYRNCTACPYAAYNEYLVMFCSVDGVLGVSAFGCIPSHIPESMRFRNMTEERKAHVLGMLTNTPIKG